MKIQLTFYPPGVINIWPVCFNETFKCLQFPSHKSSSSNQWFSPNSSGGSYKHVKKVCNCFLLFLVFFPPESVGWRSALRPLRSLLCQLWLSDLLIKVAANEHVSLITAINTVFTNTACAAKYFTDWREAVCVCVRVCARTATCVSQRRLALHGKNRPVSFLHLFPHRPLELLDL